MKKGKEVSFEIKFNGQQHQIDANVLINSMIHTTAIIHRAGKLIDSNKKVSINIKAIEKGSFKIAFEIIENSIDGIKDLFTKENVQFVANIFVIFTSVVTTHQFLKGKNPKKTEQKDDQIIITNQYDEVYTLSEDSLRAYNDNVVKEAIIKNFETINEEPAITGFEILDKNEKPLVVVERADFPEMAVLPQEIFETGKEDTVQAKLHVVRVSFDLKLNWEFLFLGNKISAKIKDPQFQEILDNGQSFAKGDILEVDLKINKKFDASLNAYYNSSYQVERVTNHIKRNEQIKLDFE